MWWLLQSTIIIAVAGSNGQYHWTPNGYLASLVGVGCAMLATMAVNSVLELLAKLRQPKNAGNQRGLQRRGMRRDLTRAP